MSEHLGYDRHDPAGRDSGNSRNGRLPAWTAQRTSGAERPLIWTMTTPGTSVLVAARLELRVLRRRCATTALSSPAVTNQLATLTMTA